MKEQKDRYEIFLKVCETGGFSKAAEALNIHGHPDRIGAGTFFKCRRDHGLPLDLVFIKIMHDHIHRESAVDHIRRILRVAVDLCVVSRSVFYDE